MPRRGGREGVRLTTTSSRRCNEGRCHIAAPDRTRPIVSDRACPEWLLLVGICVQDAAVIACVISSPCGRSCGPCPRGCLLVVVLVVRPAQGVHPLFPPGRQRLRRGPVDMHRAVRAIHFTHADGVAPRSTFHHGRVRSNRKKTKIVGFVN